MSNPKTFTPVTVYRTDDGQQFNTGPEAIIHNRERDFREEIENILSKRGERRLNIEDSYDLAEYLIGHTEIRQAVRDFHNFLEEFKEKV